MAGQFYGQKKQCVICDRKNQPMHVKVTLRMGICQACFSHLRYKDPDFKREHRKRLLDNYYANQEKRREMNRLYYAAHKKK